MAKQLRVRGGPLADVAHRAKGRLPRGLQAEIAILLDAEALASHPRLAHRVDARKVAKANRKIRAFLEKQDPKAERRAQFLDRLAAVVFILFALALAVFFFLISKGYFE